jgi:hypothetical protein
MNAQDKYLKDFATFSSAKQRRHIAIMVRYALKVIADKEVTNQPTLDALDDGTINAEYTIGGSE